VYGKYAPAQWILERFCVPLDYLAFLLAVGGTWEAPEDGSWSGWDIVSGVERLRWNAKLDAEHEAGWGRQQHPGLWVRVGKSGLHLFFVCCDRANPLFGALAHGEDTTPSADYEDVFASSFLEYVRSVPTRETRW
jgi:hypothetical protein